VIAPHEEQEAFEYFQKEEAIEWVAMQEAFKDILQQIPVAEGLDEFHRCGIVTTSGEPLPQSA